MKSTEEKRMENRMMTFIYAIHFSVAMFYVAAIYFVVTEILTFIEK